MFNGTIKTSIWDTVGQEKYRSINRAFYRDSKGALLLADVSIVQKEGDLEYWVKEFKTHADQNAKLILVGNKMDLERVPQTIDYLSEFGKRNDIPVYYTSAKTGDNVQTVLKELIEQINHQYFKNPVTTFQHQNRSDYMSLTFRRSVMSATLLSNGGEEEEKLGRKCCFV